MVKQYRRLTDEERRSLVTLIHENGFNIKQASITLNIPYANAKAVNQTYVLERRYTKKTSRLRAKKFNFKLLT